jgi:hypothetical protein
MSNILQGSPAYGDRRKELEISSKPLVFLQVTPKSGFDTPSEDSLHTSRYYYTHGKGTGSQPPTQRGLRNDL